MLTILWCMFQPIETVMKYYNKLAGSEHNAEDIEALIQLSCNCVRIDVAQQFFQIMKQQVSFITIFN